MNPAVLEELAAPRRREIVRLVWDRERTAGEIAAHFDVTWGAVSQHLTRLRAAGVLVQRRDGNRRYYRADRETLRPVARALKLMWEQQLDRLQALAEEEERKGRQ